VGVCVNRIGTEATKDFYFFVTRGQIRSLFVELNSLLMLAALDNAVSFAAVNVSRITRDMDRELNM
jgi:hypothetical protein